MSSSINMPVLMIRDHDLSPATKMVYAAIKALSDSGQSSATVDQYCDVHGYSKVWHHKLLNRLIAAGWISRDSDWEPGRPSGRKRVIYTVNDTPTKSNGSVIE